MTTPVIIMITGVVVFYSYRISKQLFKLRYIGFNFRFGNLIVLQVAAYILIISSHINESVT